LASVSAQNDSFVRKGSPLASFDTIALQAEQAALASQITLLQQDSSRLRFQTTATPTNPSPQLTSEQLSLQALQHELIERKKSLQNQLQASQAEELRLRQLLAIASSKEQQHTQLAAEGFLSPSTLQDTQAQKLNLSGQLQTQTAKSAALLNDIAAAQALIARTPHDIKKQHFTSLTQTDYSLESLKAQHSKNERILQQATLHAPFDGFLQGWTAYHPGQVLPSSSPLGKLIPSPQALSDILVETWVPASSASQLLPKLPVRIKLPALPFQKHGWLVGSIHSIASDAQTQDNPLLAPQTQPQNPLLYRVVVSFDPHQPYWHPKTHTPTTSDSLALLRLGSQAQVDIQLGLQSPFDYFTQALKKVTHSAMTER